jgi:hypothetical protein
VILDDGFGHGAWGVACGGILISGQLCVDESGQSRDE